MRDPYVELESQHPADPLDILLRSASWPDELVDPLDELLRMAEWPEPNTVRLMRTPPVDHTFAHSVVAVVVFALTLATLAATCRFYARDLAQRRPSGQDRVPTSSALHAHRLSAPPELHIAATTASDIIVSRRLRSRNDRLRTLHSIAQRDIHREWILSRPLPVGSNETDILIREYLARQMNGDNMHEDNALRAMMDRRSEVEERLLITFDSFAGELEVAATELLGQIGTDKSVQLLMRLRLKPSTQQAAAAALVRLADTQTLRRLLRTESDATLRIEMIETLRAKTDRRTRKFILATERDLL